MTSRKFFTLSFLLLNFIAPAQITIHAVVKDSATKQPVPFSCIRILHYPIGTISDGNGEFSLKIPDSLVHVIIEAFSLGYDTVRVPANSGTKEILLHKKTVDLSEFSVVSYDRSKLCKETRGNTRRTLFSGDFNFGVGSEIAVYIINSPADSGIISTLKFFLTKEGDPNTPFRAKLYRLNVKDSCPGELLSEKDLIVYPKQGNRWAEIDISDLEINIPPDGFFVAMQWLPEAKSHLTTEKNRWGTIIRQGQDIGGSVGAKEKLTWAKSFWGKWQRLDLQPSPGNLNALIGAEVLINCK